MPSQSKRAKASGNANLITNYCCFLQSVNTGARGSSFIVELKDLLCANLLALNWEKQSKAENLQTDYARVTCMIWVLAREISKYEGALLIFEYD